LNVGSARENKSMRLERFDVLTGGLAERGCTRRMLRTAWGYAGVNEAARLVSGSRSRGG
jgi:hypothetical protein